MKEFLAFSYFNGFAESNLDVAQIMEFLFNPFPNNKF